VFGVQINLAESVEHLPEKTSILKAFELVDKQELVQEDVTDVGREQADILNQVVMQLTRILTVQAFEG